VNLKERLSSTENLLRAIRGGKDSEQAPELSASSAPPAVIAKGDESPVAPKSLLRTPVSELFGKLLGHRISFSPRSKSLVCGVSFSARHLLISVVRRSDMSIYASGRYLFEPDQAPGQPGAPAFLHACIERTLGADQSAEYWAVLRSADVDLSVLSVPKLSGDKLDAAVFWTLQKDKKFTEAEYILDYLVMGPVKDAPEPRLEVLTCLARRADVDAQATLFREAGKELTGISVVPAALLNLYRRPDVPGPFTLAANIHVESDYSAIGLYSNGRLVFSRFIRSGAGSMVDDLVEHFRALAKPSQVDLHDIDLELTLPGEASQPFAAPAPSPPPVQPLTAQDAYALFQHVMLDGQKPEGLAEEHNLDASGIMQIISPAIERMARQVERTLEYYVSTNQQRCDALHFSGELFGATEVLNALALQLGYPPVAFDATAILHTPEGKVPPRRRMSLAPSIAVALSQPDRGINLVNNYKSRTAQELKQRVTLYTLLGVAFVMLFVAATGVWLERGVRAKRAELAQAQATLAALGPTIDENQLNAALQKFQLRQSGLRNAAPRMAGPAVLAELARCTPPKVKLMSLVVDTLSGPPKAAAPVPGQGGKVPPPVPSGPAANKGPQPAQTVVGTVTIEGVVLGDKADFDAELARLVLALQGSPLVDSPTVTHSSQRELPEEGTVLFFVLQMGVH